MKVFIYNVKRTHARLCALVCACGYAKTKDEERLQRRPRAIVNIDGDLKTPFEGHCDITPGKRQVIITLSLENKRPFPLFSSSYRPASPIPPALRGNIVLSL